MIGMLVHKVKTSLHLIEDASASPAGYPIAGEMYAWMTVRPWITHVFLLLLVSGAIGLFFSKGSPSFAYGLSGILFSLPAHSVSHPLWTIMPGWHVLQFSWRWLFPASILLLPVIAGLLDGGSELWKKLLIFVAVGSLASFTVALEFLSQPFSEMKLMEMMKTPVYPSEYAPRACEHWQTLNPTIGIPHQMAVMSGSGTLKIHDLGPEHFFLTADIVSEEAEIFLKTHSDPYWRLYSGETVIPLEKQVLCGTMKYRLTRGRHEVRLERVQPDGRTCGWLIMVVTMVTGFLIWRFSKPEESAGQKA